MELDRLDLSNTEWDCCVVGNGISALWISHWLWSAKKSVLWITSDEPYNSERALLGHGWLWGVKTEDAQMVHENLKGFEQDEGFNGFEVIYYDARSSKRFRRFGEAKQEWGSHEAAYFEMLATEQNPAAMVDLFSWHSKLHQFYDGVRAQGPSKVELFSDPRFVRVQGWPITEIKTSDRQIQSIILAGNSSEIRAKQFFLGDFDEPLAPFIKEPKDAEVLAGALKGKSYHAGFGLRLVHQGLESYPHQTAIVPLVVNPNEKGAGSHLVGRFIKSHRGSEQILESIWAGFFTSEEVEDNNEILKKIKQAKRAVDRAIPGFLESIKMEAVTFEPRMLATDLLKVRKFEALGAILFSDHFGIQATIEVVRQIFAGEKTPVLRKKSKSATESQDHLTSAGAALASTKSSRKSSSKASSQILE